ncbi:MAG: outer membrane lipoprotein carrier protein LolA [Myxococcales bacterium]|nr:outer membrane lipoprotein carrier protein LolA [Myxococcales bacterium]MCB9748570.1 outer membrane lipoprotein carrier protein LolA [Myxococcales bacterium]
MDFLNPCLFSLGLLCSAGISDTPTVAVDTVARPAEAPVAPVAPIATSAPNKPRSASAVLAAVQSYYNGTQDLRASFEQIYTNVVYGSRKTSTGTLLLKRPGMMVWDYDGAADADFYVDRESLWVVEHDTRQVVTSDAAANGNIAGAMKFLFGGEALVKDFRVRLASSALVKRYGQDGHTVVELKPRAANPDYKTMLLVVDDRSGRVDAFVVRNQDNAVNHFKLASTTRNAGVADAQFSFVTPAGYVESQG